MKKYLLSIVFLTLMICSGCTTIIEPTLERIEEVEILNLTTSALKMNTDLVFHNPNIFALDLARADLKVLIDDIELAKIEQTYDSSMPAKSEFSIPVMIDMNLERLYKDNPLLALTKGMKIVGEKRIDIQIVGEISVGKGFTKIRVPVDKLEMVEF